MTRRVAVALLALGCNSTPTTPAPLADRMPDHHASALGIRDAALNGDLEKVRSNAGDLKTQLTPTMLETPVTTGLMAVVDDLATSTDLDTAFEQVGDLAQRCGRCHDAMGARLPLSPGAVPPTGNTMVQEMARHKWAAEAMWLGLIRPSDEDFISAVNVLSADPLVPSGTQADSPLPPLATEIEVKVHDLAGMAEHETDPAARGRLYGQMLSRCYSCHALFGATPVGSAAPPAPK